MAEIIDTATMNLDAFNNDEGYWVYNGLDCVVTYDVFNELDAQCDDVAREVYNLSLALQAPILEMNLRGLLINRRRRLQVIDEMKKQAVRLQAQLDRLVVEGIGMPEPINWRSPKQLQELFYDTMQLPKQYSFKGGVRRVTTDENALQKLANYFIAEPICNHILALRGIGKTISFLQTKADADGRMRTSFNIAGTNTGRLASSTTDYGTGTNLQNVTSSLRSVFTADPGMMFCNIDLEQADSRNMGALAWEMLLDADAERLGDLLSRRAENIKHWKHPLLKIINGKPVWTGPVGAEFAGAYLDACESGDLHTTVTKMAQPDLAWGTMPDRKIADAIAHKNKTHRDLSKGIGHGSNYMGTPPTIAKQSRLPTTLVKDFQTKYFNAFPCIPAVQQAIIDQIKILGHLTTPLGRRRFFFGRPTEGATQREAVAFMGQSMTADEINRGLMRLWRTDKTQLLVQVHDSILFQFPEELRDEIVPMALECLSTKLTLRKGREFTVGTEAMTGWNWGYASEENPDGLRKWKGGDERSRTEKNFQLSLADF